MNHEYYDTKLYSKWINSQTNGRYSNDPKPTTFIDNLYKNVNSLNGVKIMKYHNKGKQFFCCFWLFHILMPYNIMLYFCLRYFHVFNCALIST